MDQSSQPPGGDSQVRHDDGGWISGPCTSPIQAELGRLRAQLPAGYEAYPPSAPGAPWTWTGPASLGEGIDAGAEWTSGEVLSEVRHHHAARLRGDWRP